MGNIHRAATCAAILGLLACSIKTNPVHTQAPASATQANENTSESNVRPIVVTSDEVSTLKLSIKWPVNGYRVAALPYSTKALVIEVKQGSTRLAQQIVRREGSAPIATVSIPLKASTNLQVDVKAYREMSPDLASAVPIASGTATGVTLVRSKSSSLSVTLTAANGPSITSVFPTIGAPGATVRIQAQNLDDISGAKPVVYFGVSNESQPSTGVLATSVVRVSKTTLEVVVPVAADTGKLAVVVDGVPSVNNPDFTVMDFTVKPVTALPYGTLASADSGSKLEHHDYIVVKDGVPSEFVWIPVFEAYQLIVPRNCGSGNTDKPVGYWVAKQPPSGFENVDWAREAFGGFYVGKYEASHADATPGTPSNGLGATEGSSRTLKVAQNCVPWTNVNWDQAVEACLAFDPSCHLIQDDEWTAMAVWSMLRGLTVHGNNSSGVDSNWSQITFRDDPTYKFADSFGATDRALTGSGLIPGWSGNVNLTSHTGTTGGVYDLNGNVWEWTATLGKSIIGQDYYYALNGQPITRTRPVSTGFFSSMNTDATFRRHGIPGNTGEQTTAFGQDYFWCTGLFSRINILTSAMRGGGWNTGRNAGVWALYLDTTRSSSAPGIGFRPVIRF